MEKIVNYIDKKIKPHFPKLDVKRIVNSMIESKDITEGMSLDLAFKAFVKNMDHVAYESLLKNRRPFDIRIIYTTPNVVLDLVKESIASKVENEYIFVEKGFIGIKLTRTKYNQHGKVSQSSIPFLKVCRSIRKIIPFEDIEFKDLLFELDSPPDLSSYNKILEHLKTINMPIKIIDDEIVNKQGFENLNDCSECHLTMEDRAWPEVLEARNYAKTAFYCYIYRNTPHKYLINKDFLVLEYKNSKLLLKINVEDNLFKKLREIVEDKPSYWKENMRMVKKLLGYHGFYPFYYNDYILGLMCFNIDEYFPSSFIDEMMSKEFDFDVKFSLEELKFENSGCGFFIEYKKETARIEVPENVVLKRFRMFCDYFTNLKFRIFNERFEILTRNLLIPFIKDYDFCLCQFKKYGFDRVYSNVEKPCLVTLELEELKNLGYFFYSAPLKLLMVKCKPFVSPSILFKVVLLKINFNYIRVFS